MSWLIGVVVQGGGISSGVVVAGVEGVVTGCVGVGSGPGGVHGQGVGDWAASWKGSSSCGFSRGGGSYWGSARGRGAGGEEKDDLPKAKPCEE